MTCTKYILTYEHCNELRRQVQLKKEQSEVDFEQKNEIDSDTEISNDAANRYLDEQMAKIDAYEKAASAQSSADFGPTQTPLLELIDRMENLVTFNLKS